MKKLSVGFIGLGKLGLPCALAIEDKGHTVYGYDISPQVKEIITKKRIPYLEAGAQELLDKSHINFSDSIHHVIAHSDIVFVPIQTPHDEKYEGISRLPEKRVDFEYKYLREGMEAVAKAAKQLKRHTTVIIISTVLPGTIERDILPVLNEYIHLCYNPFFIAMGTCINDFLNPEFVLLGCEDEKIVRMVNEFYKTIHDRPVFVTTIKTAELIKVAYNTFIGFKIIFVNAMMEICDKMGANVDDLSDALALATERLISPKYMRGGMGDGGGCHPRDNIAMSWLARTIHLSHDIFSDMMQTREDQTEWLVKQILRDSEEYDLPVCILGKAYKPEINLTIGSPAILLGNMLKECGVKAKHYDPYIDNYSPPLEEPCVYFIATKHKAFADYKFPVGSVVIDPFGYIKDQDAVLVKRLGRP